MFKLRKNYTMETITSFVTYNTDYDGDRPGPQKGPIYSTLPDVLEGAAILRAKLVVKTSSGSWYIKCLNDNKSREEIQQRLVQNVRDGRHRRSKSWLLYY